MLKDVSVKIALLGILVTVLVGIVNAHSNVLISIDLDYDPELKAKVIKSAQDYLGSSTEPIGIGYDKGLIKVEFDKDGEHFVEIEPYDFKVFGFKEQLPQDIGEPQYDSTQRKEIAEEIFNQIPEEYKKELRFGEEAEDFEKGIFKYTWYRYVDGIYAFGDHLEVWVNSANGEVFSWRLSLFESIPEDTQTSPAFNSKVATKIAELRFSATPLDFKPVLVIMEGRPTWITKVKKLYPIYVAVDALDGNVIFTGALRENLPEGYSIGKEVPIVETKLIKKLKEK